MIKQDPRIAKTLELLKIGFIDLLLENTLEQVTIKKLTSSAKINRTTFYLHFTDINDFVEQMINQIIEDWTIIANEEDPNYSYHSISDPYPGFIKLLQHIHDEAILYRILLVENRVPVFTTKVREWVIGYIKPGFESGNVAYDVNSYVPSLRHIHLASGTLGAITWWIEKDFPLNAQDFAIELTKIGVKGALFS
ncbi:TetR/AcrR family transcriptional regulator [Bacillus sp. CGMCC 1.16607]|uniref:TetR/AcrR family transcriptional regulator n=1 Tax=Bacillus sp. CGMCC 1.16607 TaxID=3351842 RepID=UPI00362E42C8